MSSLKKIIKMKTKAQIEATLHGIVEGRKQSKYHKNYIATHVVEKLLISLPLSLLETLREKVEGMYKDRFLPKGDSGVDYNQAIEDVLALLDEQITALK